MSGEAALSVLDQLVVRSRRLGADRTVCNWGGGNTSAKSDETDFRGRRARVLWVKGSGSDLATCTAASFTGLYLDDIAPLLEGERMSDTEMVDYLAHCFFDPGRPRPSIETLLHGFLPFAHIDHTHADATNFLACAQDDVLAFAGSADAPRLTRIGAACPDHLVHTKPWPLLVDWTPDPDQAGMDAALRTGVETYVAKYQAYLDANAAQDLDPDAAEPVLRAADAASDPHPRVILIPGVGMFTTGKDSTMADVAAQLYHRAIAVMRGAEACGGFVSLSDAESYAGGDWPLEQYKLKLAPPQCEVSRQGALLTGAAAGIRAAICPQLATAAAHHG